MNLSKADRRYWGKRDTKLILPTNSSLSVTLDQDHLRSTTTSRADESFEKGDKLWLNGKDDPIKEGGRLWVCIKELRAWRKEMEEKDSSLPKVSSPHAMQKGPDNSYHLSPYESHHTTTSPPLLDSLLRPRVSLPSSHPLPHCSNYLNPLLNSLESPVKDQDQLVDRCSVVMSLGGKVQLPTVPTRSLKKLLLRATGPRCTLLSVLHPMPRREQVRLPVCKGPSKPLLYFSTDLLWSPNEWTISRKQSRQKISNHSPRLQ
jgi:hypothetical protein